MPKSEAASEIELGRRQTFDCENCHRKDSYSYLHGILGSKLTLVGGHRGREKGEPKEMKGPNGSKW